MSHSWSGLAILAALVLPVSEAAAKQESYRADYSVTLLGLPVAKASFDSTFTGDRFSINGSLASSGIARLFERTDGTTSTRGSVTRDGVRPQSFVADYTSGKKKARTTIAFSGDRVTKVENTPTPRRGGDWIPVPGEQLKAALDPLSSTLIRTTDPSKVCNRTIRVFDGEMRADLRLTHRETGAVRGFTGEGVTCDARFVPVAGYRKGRSQIEFLKNRSRIQIAFMRLGETGFYTPVDASIGTQVGTLRIRLSSLQPR